MTKLTDIQLILLTLGAQRDDGSLLPPSHALDGKASQSTKAIAQLIKRGLAGETETSDPARIWREDGDIGFGVIITEAGKRAIGLAEAETSPAKVELACDAGATEAGTATIEAPPAASKPPRADSKQAKVLSLLKRKGGASVSELMEASGWLAHTTRAALTGFRKRGIAIEKTKVDGVTRYTAPSGVEA